MLIAIVAIVILFIIYQLLVNGYLFKIPLFFGGMFGVYLVLCYYFPSLEEVGFDLGGIELSKAATISSIIGVLALATTKS